jgi:CRP-like cAMP-binding protein
MEGIVRARTRNLVLDYLRSEDFDRLEPSLQRETLGFRRRLQSANRRVETVFFPESGVASTVAMGGGERRQAEVAIIGREGFVGIPIILADDRSPHEIFMQAEGTGYSVPATTFRSALDASPSLRQVCLRYAHAYFIQCAATTVANTHAHIDHRLARWLLMTHDRLETAEMLLTHEFLSLMLGVRRAGVTTAIQEFERRGLISAARGSITLLDRDGLLEVANGFYGAAEAEFERLFPNDRH